MPGPKLDLDILLGIPTIGIVVVCFVDELEVVLIVDVIGELVRSLLVP